MALTAAQKVTVTEITRESPDDVSAASDALSAEQQTVLIADVNLWASGSTPVRNSFVKLKGGKSGVDFDNERKRAAIFFRVRDLLGFDEISYERISGAAMQLVELEVGANFG